MGMLLIDVRLVIGFWGRSQTSGRKAHCLCYELTRV